MARSIRRRHWPILYVMSKAQPTTKKSWSWESYLDRFAMHQYTATKPCTAQQECHITATRMEVYLASAK